MGSFGADGAMLAVPGGRQRSGYTKNDEAVWRGSVAATAGPLTIWQGAQAQYKRARGRTLYIYKRPNGLICATSPRPEGGLFTWKVKGNQFDHFLFANRTWFYVWMMWFNSEWR